MNDVVEIAKEQFSKVPPWGWIAIAGGFVVVAFVYSRKPSVTMAPAPSYSGGGLETNKVSESEVAHRIQNVVTGLNQQFDERFNEQASVFRDELQARDEALESYQAGFAERVGAMTSLMNEQNQSLLNQLDEVSEKAKAPVILQPEYAPKSSTFGVAKHQWEEIRKKAEAGIALSDATPQKQALYKEWQEFYVYETQRKAIAGEELSNPNPFKNKIYDEVRQAMGGA